MTGFITVPTRQRNDANSLGSPISINGRDAKAECVDKKSRRWSIVGSVSRTSATTKRRRASRFLVRFDRVGGYLALGGLEIQLGSAYELVEFPLEAHLSHKNSRAMFWLIGAKGYEWNSILPTRAESSDQLRNRLSYTP